MAKVSVTILAETGFIPTELALIQDALRIAERLEPNFECILHVCTSGNGTIVEGIGGALVRASHFETEIDARPDYLVILGGQGVDRSIPTLKARLSWMERMGVTLILLSDAAAIWKRLNDHRDDLTSHWENEELERDAGFSYSSDLPLYIKNSRTITCAGMVSTADLILNHVVGSVSLKLAQSVAQMMLCGEIRDGMTAQPRSASDVLALEHAKLAPIISAMENAVEVPLSTTELASIAGFSVRQMERKFRALLDKSPVSYYRSIRLRRAKRLIEQTPLRITEISLACGFGSPSGFSKRYLEEFGISPTKHRALLAKVAPVSASDTEDQGTFNASRPFSPRPLCASVHSAGTHEAPVQRAGR